MIDKTDPRYLRYRHDVCSINGYPCSVDCPICSHVASEDAKTKWSRTKWCHSDIAFDAEFDDEQLRLPA
jgi:hypothetical protein